jgi:hypothetical protein
VEKASSSQRALVIRPDSRLAFLLNASLDDQVDRAVAALARGLVVEAEEGSSKGAEMNPIATAKFSYTILRGN